MSSSTSPCESSADEGDDTMARTSNRGSQMRRVELDFTSVLSSDQLSHLTALVAAIIEGIESQINQNHDNLGQETLDDEGGILPPQAVCFSVPNPRSDLHKESFGNVQIEATTYKEVTLTDRDASTTVQRIPQSLEEATRNSSKSQNELLIESIREQQKDVTNYFFKFKSNIQKRMQDISVKYGGTAGDPGSGTASRRPASFAKQKPPLNLSLASELPQINGYKMGAEYRPLSSLSNHKRGIILHCLVLLVIGLEQYSSYSRVFLETLAASLGVPKKVLADDELRIATGLAEMIESIPIEEINERRLEESLRQTRRPRGANVERLTVPAIPSTTLAPSLVAQGVGSMFLGKARIPPSTAAALLGNVNESTIVVGTMFGLYGSRLGGKTMDTFAKDIQEFGLVSLRDESQSELVDPKDVPATRRRLRVSIAVSGWITDVPTPFTKPWKVIGEREENYTLQWETDALAKMGLALETVLRSRAWCAARRDSISEDVFLCLEQSLWPASLIKISKIIENPWTVGMVRAEKAGQMLAESLLNRLQGERAINLVGFSLGARVIYACLMVLAEKRAFGLVQNVVLMGAPIPTEMRVWVSMSSVVAGRLVNVFSSHDYLLGFLSRGTNWKYGVAGLQKVQGVPNVENLDLGELAASHFRYQHLTSYVLQKLEWDDLNVNQVALDKAAYDALVHTEHLLETEATVDVDKEAEAVTKTLERREKDAAEHRRPARGAGRNKTTNSRRREGPGSGKSKKTSDGSDDRGPSSHGAKENQIYSQNFQGGLRPKHSHGEKGKFQASRGNSNTRDLAFRPAHNRRGRDFQKQEAA